MKKLVGLFTMSLLVLSLAVFQVGCQQTSPPTTVLPSSGDWKATAEFGDFVFTVNPESTGIAKVSFDFKAFKCGGVTSSGGISVEKADLWPITDGQFTLEVYVRPWNMVIEGTFDESGSRASGTWEVTGTGCSGTWESRQSP